MADGEWRERRRGGERGRYLHARREQGVGVGGGTSTRRGIGQEVPISIFLAARTQHRGVIVAARRTQCCTQASRRAGVPDRGGIQGPGSLSPPKCSCSAGGGGGTYDPARQVALYSTWGRVPMAAAPSSKAPHKLTDTDTLTPTHRETEWSVRRTCPRRAGLLIETAVHTLPLSLSQERQPEYVTLYGACACALQVCPSLAFPSSNLLLLQLSCKSREQGTRAKKETAKQGTER